MADEENYQNDVTCCICGKGLTFDNSIHIALTFPKSPNETQGLYCHSTCLDEILHKSVPRHPDISEGK